MAHRTDIRIPRSPALTESDFLASGSTGSRRFLILQAQFCCDDHTLEGRPSIPLVDDPDRRDHLEHLSQEEDMAWKLGSLPESLRIHLEGGNFLTVIRNGYWRDTLFSKVIRNVAQHPRYAMHDGVLYFMSAVGDPVIAIPGSLSKGRRVTEISIDQAHCIVGHKAARKTHDYLAHWYWWPSMAKDVKAFCKSCRICQTTNASMFKPKGLLHALRTPLAPWSSIAMDFVGPPPEVHGYDDYHLYPHMHILSHRALQSIPQQA